MIHVITCVWNAEKYIKNCIKSVLNQNSKEWKMTIIDDMSEDSTVSLISKLIEGEDRINLIVNTEKKFKLKNFDEVISYSNDQDIILELDGDDFLLNRNTFSKILEVYSDGNTWITNGSFVYTNGTNGFSAKCNPSSIRTDVFRFSHLRTWKSFLWKQIPKEYFQDENGSYFKSAADVAYSIPLLELAGVENYTFLSDIFYAYNGDSPLNDHKPGSASGNGLSEQTRCATLIRNKPKLNKFLKV